MAAMAAIAAIAAIATTVTVTAPTSAIQFHLIRGLSCFNKISFSFDHQSLLGRELHQQQVHRTKPIVSP